MANEGDSRGADVFLENLQRLSLGEDDISNPDLIVPPGSSLVLSRSAKHASNYRPLILQTTDLDELKGWIGIPDDAVKSKTFVSRGERAHIKELSEYCKCNDSEAPQIRRDLLITRIREDGESAAKTTSLRSYTRSYLFGDSAMVAEAKPLLQDYYSIIEVAVWLFPNITVKSGSVLSFGSGSNILLANNLEIEEGGRIVSYGSLTVKVSTLRKTNPRIVRPIYDLNILKKRFFRSAGV